MSELIRRRVILAIVCGVGAGVFVSGIHWGLPSRAVDPYLFGDEPAWAGEKIVRLAPREADVRGADVDANPIVDRDRPVWLNQTDEQRAEIIRRYRLFSYQPDEFITFKSLSRLRENRGDPRLYQYGGLWIYPVGALIKVALHPRADQAYYIDHPEAFGRFYVVARLYTAAWGVVGVWAVFWLARRITGDVPIAAAAAMCYIFMPVVVTMAHEAKPHLPGAVLMLLAVIAATKYLETGARKWWVATGSLCGAALGMVLSAMMIFSIIPVMTLMRWRSGQQLRVMLMTAVIGMAVYVALNPYVAINALFHRDVLRSNLQNSTAMYAPGVSAAGLMQASYLIAAGMSVGLAILGVAGALHWLVSPSRPQMQIVWLLVAPAALVLVQFVLLARDKPPEYARFAILPDIVLIIMAMNLVSLAKRPWVRAGLAGIVVVFTMASGLLYVRAFVRDTQSVTSRIAAAEALRMRLAAGAKTMSVWAEPAPYCLPPVNLFHYRLILSPPGKPYPADVFARVQTYGTSTPISWADTRFIITASLHPDVAR